MCADGSSQSALAKWALLIIRPGTSRHYRLGRVIKALEKVPTGGGKKPVAFIDQHLELLLFLLSGGKIVDRKRLKDSNRLHCLVKLATLLATRSEEHTSELQSLMRISYAVFCLKKKKQTHRTHTT